MPTFRLIEKQLKKLKENGIVKEKVVAKDRLMITGSCGLQSAAAMMHAVHTVGSVSEEM